MKIELHDMIVGPCAAQSHEQVMSCARFLKERGILKMRASWYKPRTSPGFEGVGDDAAPWAAEATNLGIEVGTEVLMPGQVSDVINGVARCGGDISKLFMWIGSRNQNHIIQREIAQRVLNESPENVMLLIKNQPWHDEGHSVGIAEHVLSSGIDPHRIAYIWRGYKAHPAEQNTDDFRNMPHWETAMRVKERLNGIPMLIDPSHIGGTVGNVMKIMKHAAQYSFDGAMIELNPLPPELRLTDKGQQMSFEQFDKLSEELSKNSD